MARTRQVVKLLYMDMDGVCSGEMIKDAKEAFCNSGIVARKTGHSVGVVTIHPYDTVVVRNIIPEYALGDSKLIALELEEPKEDYDLEDIKRAAVIVSPGTTVELV